MAERVLVTGLGLISPLGTSLKEYWSRLCEGDSTPEEYPNLPPHYMENRLMYRVPPRNSVNIGETGKPMGIASQFALSATANALEDADLSVRTGRWRIGVAMGTGMGNHDLLDNEREGGRKVSGENIFFFQVASAIARQYSLRGPTLNISTACSAGAYSVSLARDIILGGSADVMIAGGAESFSRVPQACFNRLGALDPSACRPFSANRLGTVFGEGAALLILEAESHFRRRGGVHHYAEVKGCGWSCDGYHITAPEPSGHQIQIAAHRALADAGIDPAAIDCILPHGTGTKLNDLVESSVMEKLFSQCMKQPWAFALKSKIGHGGGAAGAFSCLTAALMLKHGCVPHTANLSLPDPQCKLSFITHRPICASLTHIMVNAYAFGGNNVSVILGQTVH